jgi:hypothetical protein
MHPDARRFIELSTRPLEREPEIRQAEAELEKAIENSSPQQLAEAADMLSKADSRPHRRKWWIALYLITLVVSLPLLAHTLKQVSRTSEISGLFSPMSQEAPKPISIPHLTDQQKLLLDGDRNAATAADRWRPLWESDPENAAYLAEYASAYFRDHKQLSPEIREAAERLDPDNGWFIALAAAAMAEGTVTRKGPNDNAVFTIHDEQRLRETLTMLHQLVRKPRFKSYLTELHRERFALLPPRRDFVSQIPSMAYVASYQVSNIPFRRFADAWAAGAQQCAAKGDVAGFKKIIADWHAFIKINNDNSDAFVNLLITKVMMLGPAKYFRDAAHALKLADEERYFQRLVDYSKAEKQRRQTSGDAKDNEFRRKSSLFGGLSGPMLARQVQSSPPLTDAELRPGRHADHAFFGRVLTGPAWLLFGLAVVFTAFGRYRHNPLTRRLSLRMLDLLCPSDWILLFLGGLVAPVLWYLFISRLSPLAAREWSVTVVSLIPVCGQFGSLVASVIILPVTITGRLLEKRGANFLPSPRFWWPGWLAAAAALAAIPLFGAVPHDTPFSKGLLVLSLVLAGIAVVWILGGLIVLCRKSRSLGHATLIRMVLPVWVAAMLVMALSLYFHYAEEERWIQQDRIGEITADSPSLSHYEHLVTEVLRREILETLGILP